MTYYRGRRAKRLKPCPFCGNKDVKAIENPYGLWYVLCDVCHTEHWGGDREDCFADSEREAVAHWNRRFKDDGRTEDGTEDT